MAEGSQKKGTPPKSLLPEVVNESTIDGLEKKAIENANKTISALEEAIAVWDGAKEKPEEYADKIKMYRWLLGALSEWMRTILQNQKRKQKLEERVRMLERFVDICQAYRGA